MSVKPRAIGQLLGPKDLSAIAKVYEDVRDRLVVEGVVKLNGEPKPSSYCKSAPPENGRGASLRYRPVFKLGRDSILCMPLRCHLG